MGNYKDWIHKILTDEQYAEEWEATVQKLPNGTPFTRPDKYKPEYDQIAFDIMSDENAVLCHLSVALECTEPTIHSWIKRHLSFREAFIAGKTLGEKAFREKLKEHAYQPASGVNNKIIGMLAKNVHGIDPNEASIVIHNTNEVHNGSTQETAKMFADALNRDLED